jgi:demethylmenaquinone methyltransferase/2-methoxy-6-polyprenyl-1,4-benzoquinol methylase
MTEELKQTFGFERVDTAGRRRRIRGLFDAIAPRYDLMNDLMSFGIHRLWKRAFVRRVLAAAGAGQGAIIDLAGGTGDIARLLRARGARDVVVVDASAAMMREGMKLPGARGLRWVAAEGERLPLADDSVAAITISFGLRNMSDPDAALREIHRVLKPGGHLFCLEFSRPAWWLKPFYDLYSFFVIPRLGAMVAGHPRAYRYLVESIRRFPGQKALTEKIRAAGFADVRWRNLSFGIAAIHHARKGAAA